MLATQKGRSKPSRISWSLWLKRMSPPRLRGGMIADRDLSERLNVETLAGRKAPPTPPIRCMNVKAKGIENGQFVSACKERTRMMVVGGGRRVPEWELLVYTPVVFVRVATKGLTGYGK